MNTSVITINQLTRHFKETVAVDNLSLEVCTGEIFSFLGHNGSAAKAHIRNILSKLQVSSRAEAVAFAIKNKLISL